MTEDDETLVAALQLLLGDADNKRLFTLLTNAFGGKIAVIPPNVAKAISNELTDISVVTRRANDMVSAPPLGKLACDRLKTELETALNGIRKLENFLGNQTR